MLISCVVFGMCVRLLLSICFIRFRRVLEYDQETCYAEDLYETKLQVNQKILNIYQSCDSSSVKVSFLAIHDSITYFAKGI